MQMQEHIRLWGRYSAWLMGALCASLAGRLLWTAATAPAVNLAANGLLVLILLTLAYALLRDQRWARRGMSRLLLLIAFVIPIGLINPFRAGDMMAAGERPPTVPEMLVWMVPLEIALLAVAFLLDYRRDPQ